MSAFSKLIRRYWKPLPTRSLDLLSTRFAPDSDWPVKSSTSAQAGYRQSLADALTSGELQLKNQNCPCGQTTHNTIIANRDRYGLLFDSVVCDACGTVRLDPYFEVKRLATFYADIYQGLYARATELAEYFDRQLPYGNKIRELLFGNAAGDGRKVLEVGCGAGGGLSAFEKAGFEVQGCDYSAELVNYGRSRGVKGLTVGPVDMIAARRQKFDLVYLHHVFEHVGEPLPTLRMIQRLLKPDGKLMIIVPDISLVQQYHRGKGDPIKLIHVAHKYNYTLTCFEQMARKTRLAAKLFTPSDAPTAWNYAPELWIELSCTKGSAHQPLQPNQFKGKGMILALKKAERAYLAQLSGHNYIAA